jgi:hypothetical protein
MILLIVAGVLVMAYFTGFLVFLYAYYKLSDLGYDLPGPMNPTLMSQFHSRFKAIIDKDDRKEVKKIFKIYRCGITVAALLLLPAIYFLLFSKFVTFLS